MVHRFYNMRRRAVAQAKPNAAHIALAKLEDRHEVAIVTQNIDDLHERAESSRVLHLHGEIMKARCTCGAGRILSLGDRDIVVGDLCPEGSQLRPHVVWFGEEVTEYARAIPLVRQADLLMVIGTSLQVYPAAGLVEFVCQGVPIYVVNPDDDSRYLAGGAGVTHFAEPAAQAVPQNRRRVVEGMTRQSLLF